ncbi:DUF5005 domain-containing protein [Mucilaginibacter limnophilus]|uniref:DUF5005 domain-containing protein n=1 Tax=Mucilaginibacter limnophilus TaxID=1932778 RepID=A0A3S2UQJ1_9SPHI|nr:DUF4185 domain-containing protein [Mucilaginibacter limnophilus]RVU02025.1 DUF5005 domain-containing protein [Mucilaginibacter limnophilus]
MKSSKFVIVLLLCGISSGTALAQNTDLTTLNFTVEEAPEWTALFKRTSGWFGADGVYSIPLNGSDKPGNNTKTLLLFSDTMIGEIKDGKPQPGYTMVNNTNAFISGEPKPENIKFNYPVAINGKPLTTFIPNTPNTQKGEYYWLGDGFVNETNGKVYIHAYRVRNDKPEDVWAFEEKGTTLISFPKNSQPPFKDQKQMDTPFFIEGKTPTDYGVLGSAVFVNTEKAGAPAPDGHIYVYGTRTKNKTLLVARVQPKDYEDFTKWRYWDGTAWNTDINKIADVTDRVSHELSVTPLADGRYILIFQEDGIGNNVSARLSTTPYGPFGPVIKLYETTVNKENKNFLPYNAKAHPNLSKPGELLVSYNVISFDFYNDMKIYPQHYRPRFVRLKFGDK